MNSTCLGHCWKEYFSRGKGRLLHGHTISQGSAQHAVHLLPGTATGVGAPGGEVLLWPLSCKPLLASVFRCHKSTWVHQEQLYHGTSVLLGQTWSFLLQGLELVASESDYSHHHLPVLLCAAGGQVLTCVTAIPWKCGEKSVFLIYPEDNVLNKLCSYLNKASVPSGEAPFPNDYHLLDATVEGKTWSF